MVLSISLQIIVVTGTTFFLTSAFSSPRKHNTPPAYKTCTKNSIRPIEAIEKLLQYENDHGTDSKKGYAKSICNSNHQNTIYLVSIPPLSDEAPSIVRELWEWKNTVLGDGRDYFVPRPRALKALSNLLLETEFGEFKVTECAILSNCARMDVLLSLERQFEYSEMKEPSSFNDVGEKIRKFDCVS